MSRKKTRKMIKCILLMIPSVFQIDRSTSYFKQYGAALSVLSTVSCERRNQLSRCTVTTRCYDSSLHTYATNNAYTPGS